MKPFIKVVQFIYCLYVILVFASLTILAAIALLFLLPFGLKQLGNRVYFICRYWSKILYLFIGFKHKEIYEAPHQFNRPHIFVGNHNSYMDIPPVVLIAHNPLRILGKFESSKIPIFGWIYREAVIMVDRSNPERRAQSVRDLKQAIADGLSIFIFPEGTFNESENPLKSFYDGAFRIAIETQTPIKPLLFIDTIERMHFSTVFSITPGKSRVVYLADIPVAGLTLDDLPDLKARAYKQMEEGLRRYRKYPTVLSVF